MHMKVKEFIEKHAVYEVRYKDYVFRSNGLNHAPQYLPYMTIAAILDHEIYHTIDDCYELDQYKHRTGHRMICAFAD